MDESKSNFQQALNFKLMLMPQATVAKVTNLTRQRHLHFSLHSNPITLFFSFTQSATYLLSLKIVCNEQAELSLNVFVAMSLQGETFFYKNFIRQAVCWQRSFLLK